MLLRQTLVFAETVDTNQQLFNLSDTIEFTEQLLQSPYAFHDNLVFSDRVSVKFGNQTISVVQTLNFTQVGSSKQLEIGVYENIFFQDYARIPQTDTQILIFTEFAEAFKGENLTDTLIFTDTVNRIFTKYDYQTDVLIFTDRADGYKENLYWIGVEVPVALATPNEIKHRTIKLASGPDNVILPTPEIGDTNKIEKVRIQRNSRGGRLIIYSNPYWYQTDTISYRFSFLTLFQINKLKNFVRNYSGVAIELTDYEDQSYNVFITSSDLEYEQTGKNNYTTNLVMVKL